MKDIIEKQRCFFKQGNTKDYHFRIEQLKYLKKAILKYQEQLVEAIYHDMNRPKYESYLTEIFSIVQELNYHIKHLKKWMRDRRVRNSLASIGSKSYFRYQAYGTVLIIAPWNYPLMLVFEPLIAAISAGNTAIIKLSDKLYHTNQIIQQLVGENFSNDYIYIINNNQTSIQEMMSYHYDFIFFTGSTHTGQKVMEAAAKNLTPVCLELGGKSPCVVDSTANLKKTVRSIVFGKLLNSGQTCIAPDYIFVHRLVYDRFIEQLII